MRPEIRSLFDKAADTVTHVDAGPLAASMLK